MCEEGYSPISSTNLTCVRDCAEGENGNIFISDGTSCWPVCPNGTNDIGPSCIKTTQLRSTITWESPVLYTDSLGNPVTRRLDPINGEPISGLSNLAGCPKGYQAFFSSEIQSGSKHVINCFKNCIDIDIYSSTALYPPSSYVSSGGNIFQNQSSQTITNINVTSPPWVLVTINLAMTETGNCLNNQCPLDEIANNGSRIPQATGNVVLGTCNRGPRGITRSQTYPNCGINPFNNLQQVYTLENIPYTTNYILPNDLTPSNSKFESFFTCADPCPKVGETNYTRIGNLCYDPASLTEDTTPPTGGIFSDGNFSLPFACGAGFSLWGTSKHIQDNSGGINGYYGENTPSPYRVALLATSYSSLKNYVVGDIVYMFEDGQEFSNPPLNTKPNSKYKLGLGPFFRCILNSIGNSPPISVSTMKYFSDSSDTVLSNSFWTTAGINNSIIWENTVRAGDSNFLSALCFTDDAGNKFCPPLCNQNCPPTIDEIQQTGLYETDFTYNLITSEITNSVCFPRCGSGDSFISESNLCVPNTGDRQFGTVPGNSNCPFENNEFGVIATPGESPDLNICLAPCPEGFAIKNEEPYDTCISVCPQSESFSDSTDRCIKIPYTKKEAFKPTVLNDTLDTERNLSMNSVAVSKVALSGGTTNIIIIMGILGGLALFVAIVLVLIHKNRSSVGK